VDEDYLQVPRRWDMDHHWPDQLDLRLCDLFHDALRLWGMGQTRALSDRLVCRVSLLTQTLIIHIIRTAKIPFIQSRRGDALIARTVIICMIGMALPYTSAGEVLGFALLPSPY
jgi:Mg2+-importing ATPase